MEEKYVNFKITIGDRDFDAFLAKKDWEQAIDILTKNKKQTGYEKDAETAYCSTLYGVIMDTSDLVSPDAKDKLYNLANCYSSKTVAENNFRADTLLRKLRRFAVEHRRDELDWIKETCKYGIRYGNGQLSISSEIRGREFGQIYFDSKEAAQLAINTFYDELIWYFTEYKDSL